MTVQQQVAAREAQLAQDILATYFSPTALQPSPELLPDSLESAERVQDRIVAGIGELGAWKLGASTPAVRQKNGFDRIFFGALPQAVVLDARERSVLEGARFTGVESEFGFRFGRDLPPRSEPYSAQEVLAAIAEVLPTLEVPGSRFTAIGVHGPFGLVADNGASGFLIHGSGQAQFDPAELLDTEVVLEIDGQIIARGTGSEIIDGPFGSLVQFVNLATGRGYTLRRNQLVATGSCTAYNLVPRGSQAKATFGRFGSVAVSFAN
ncbi:2-keto-4-pentenoate hydratase [Solimonas aquatica]|uniref:2-keto-4-pentenoate hydratase n=1 Tax=Solimonas aquatica TaxID=489703 RepID=A0A1H9BUK9_9GAMM|nr:hypothetical protein [Solimonas aquatica]SEP92622.1 2-keto-4-pentenoate hydratase [Solimonas aquatica]